MYSYEFVSGGNVVVRLSIEFIDIDIDDYPPTIFAFAYLLVWGLVWIIFIWESDTKTALLVPRRSAVATCGSRPKLWSVLRSLNSNSPNSL